MRGMRNRMAHGYFDINLEIVWETMCNDLPGLEATIRAVIETDSGCVSRPAFHPSYASLNLIFRSSCSTAVRLMPYPLRGTMTTEQLSCYKTGQIKNSQQIPHSAL